ncbi:MAG: hypothetical protein WBH57_05075 [Anaerolineae bacterium]
MEMPTKTKRYAVVGLLGVAAGALAIVLILRRLPDPMRGMITGMMREMMEGMEPGTMPDM